MTLPSPKKLNAFSSTSMLSSSGWELSASVSSLSHFLTTLRADTRRLGVSTRLPRIAYALATWSLSPCLSAMTITAFTSTWQRRSRMTSELVSISMPALWPTVLNASTIAVQSSDGIPGPTSANSADSNEFIVSLQINPFVPGGLTFATWDRDTNSVAVKHCRLFQTLRGSPATLALTCRARQIIASSLTKACALFVTRSVNGLLMSNFPGPTATVKLGDVACKSWDWFSLAMLTGSSVTSAEISNTKCAGQSLPLVKDMTKPFNFVQKSPSGQIRPHEWAFSTGSSTPFKRRSPST